MSALPLRALPAVVGDVEIPVIAPSDEVDGARMRFIPKSVVEEESLVVLVKHNLRNIGCYRRVWDGPQMSMKSRLIQAEPARSKGSLEQLAAFQAKIRAVANKRREPSLSLRGKHYHGAAPTVPAVALDLLRMLTHGPA
jgi:hypothetical protein